MERHPPALCRYCEDIHTDGAADVYVGIHCVSAIPIRSEGCLVGHVETIHGVFFMIFS